MRRIRYAVAASLDGYIAGPNGEADWIIMDPEIDFGEIFAQFDAVLVGRKTYQAVARMEGGALPSMKSYVFSRTMQPSDCPDATLLGEDYEDTLRSLKNSPGKDIWLFGGGSLFRSLLRAGFVDTVEVAVMPALLGEGIPLLETPAPRAALELTGHTIYKSGIVSLEYKVK